MQAQISHIETSYSQRGAVSYRAEVSHGGLNKHRTIRGSNSDEVKRKAQLQAHSWNEAWAKKQAQEARRQAIDRNKQIAMERTGEAEKSLHELEHLLNHGLQTESLINWESLKDATLFGEPHPNKPRVPKYRLEPQRNDPKFAAHSGLLDNIFKSRKARKEAEAQQMYEVAHSKWTADCAEVDKAVETAERQFAEDVKDWGNRRDSYRAAQSEKNAAIDRRRELCESRDQKSIEEYFSAVLSKSEYPDWMPRIFEVHYNPDNEIILVSYSLPSIDALPRLRQVTYVQSRDQFTEKEISNAQAGKLYDAVVYQIALRTVHEIYDADQMCAIASVVFNGQVTSVDKGTGLNSTACIMSLLATRDEFVHINLARVDPKECFKALKGVGSSKLFALTPVAPIMDFSREDERFISGRDLADSLDESVNLATMDWDDFEHLIRELFEQEFRSSGGEVKITQASRDGGVDSVAFDPDPIRGGKIVIQAKRYTNTVGVAAVRDLYGTAVNEGATKGILVTTSDYGPDAYSFAKDKPLTLMNGANLLHLLERHGHKAQIDIKAVKSQLAS